jgi:hypothetical protein
MLMEPSANRTRVRRTSDYARTLAVFAVVVLAAALAGTTSAATLRSSAAPAPCLFVAKGAPWAYKGQKGTAYTAIVEGGASCSTARAWVPRLTHEHAAFDLKPVPAGWHCSTISGVTTGLTKTGQCTTHAGGIIEWLPKLKK